MIRDIGSSIGNAIFENLGRAASRVQENKSLPSDLLESDDAYLVVFDTPGATASDIQVRYVDDRVEVRVDRFREFYEGFDMRYPGRGLSLDGSVTLPGDADVDPETARATLKSNGTLHVRVPKVAESAEDDEDESAEDAVESGDETDVAVDTADADDADEQTDGTED
ncbi:Hsp20/alpha crystallin family protein [Haloarcula salina]|uniref:Hsp20/alpha crystallin family protein n=1 Tax=Haloarcula salina TaxID=1429914 RepID=A0AA41FZ56_9EURY|nr:Hsp20/alpha crystallin family protein [Haloarcula salina]MBV0901460.1 Hsp20/alpha crystallin family protein [Haloarcula salina]